MIVWTYIKRFWFLIAIIVIFGIGITDRVMSPYESSGDVYRTVLTSPRAEAAQNSESELVVELSKDEPEVRFKKWNGEVDFGIGYERVAGSANRALFDDVMVWGEGQEEVHAYPIEAHAGMEGGGFEIEVVLQQKPSYNEFVFTIDGYENLEFFYQQPLTEEPVDGETCTEIECKNAAGDVTRQRAENIIGSYAVYHKEKRGHVIGETNYGTGKAFHIYRPKAIDAEGREQWAELVYINGALIVEVPQEFLDTATYPVRVDPTFGKTTIGASTVNTGGPVIIGSDAVAPENGILTSVSHYRVTPATEGAGVYSSSGGLPSALLTTDTGNISVTGPAAWYTQTVTPAVISAGTTYWLMTFTPSNTVMYFDSETNGGRFQIATFETWPDPASTSAYNGRFSIYATYDLPVSTSPASSVGSTTATLVGELSSASGSMEIGFTYGLNESFTATTTVHAATSSVGVFSTPVTGLTTLTEYIFKAYQDDGVAVTYGDPYTFLTATISTGTPITADSAVQDSWDISGFDDGTLTNTVDDGGILKLEVQ